MTTKAEVSVQGETLEEIVDQLIRVHTDYKGLWFSKPAIVRNHILSALRNERERAAKSLDERVRQCDEHVTLNDQQGREYGYGCWRDIANALRHAARAIREGR